MVKTNQWLQIVKKLPADCSVSEVQNMSFPNGADLSQISLPEAVTDQSCQGKFKMIEIHFCFRKYT